MNAKVTSQLQKPLDWKVAVGVILGIAALGALVYWVFFAEPAPAWRVKWRIQRHLKKNSGRSDFRVEFKFPSKAAMAKAPAGAATAPEAAPAKGELTKKDFDTLRGEYLDLAKEVILLQRDVATRPREITQHQEQMAAWEKQLAAIPTNTRPARVSALQSNITFMGSHVADRQKELQARQQTLSAKEKALEPIESDLWAFQRVFAAHQQEADATGTNDLAIAQAELIRETRRKLYEASTYEAMYELIGQELWVAARLFPSANPQHRRVALAIARQADADALRIAEDAWLAARICEAYFWPNLDVADYSNRQAPLYIETLLDDCATAFSQANETNNVIRTYLTLLAKTKNPQRADSARVQLAQIYESQGQIALAVRYLKEVKNPSNFRWVTRRLPGLEQQLKRK